MEAHFALIALFFLMTVICLFSLFQRIEPVKGYVHPVFSVFFACVFFLLGDSFPAVFMNLVYAETQVIALFSLFMFLYYRALETGKSRYYIAALAAAVYSSYCKEPVFGSFLVVAASNFLFGYKNQSKKEKLFYAALTANGVLFVVLYVLFSQKNARLYNEGIVTIYGLQYVVSILRRNPLLMVMTIFGLFRLGAIVIKKDRGHLYYDSLLFAGIAYTFAYVLLHLNAGYYFMPSIVLFLPLLVYWVKYWHQTKKHRALAAFGLFALICFYHIENIAAVSDTWRERKAFIPYMSNLLSEYNEGEVFVWYESDNVVDDDTFYKAVRDWRKVVENAFLNYVNKSEGKEFFTLSRNMREIDWHKNMLFFYPAENDKNQPMPETLVETLNENDFELFLDSYSVLIYKRRE